VRESEVKGSVVNIELQGLLILSHDETTSSPSRQQHSVRGEGIGWDEYASASDGLNVYYVDRGNVYRSVNRVTWFGGYGGDSASSTPWEEDGEGRDLDGTIEWACREVFKRGGKGRMEGYVKHLDGRVEVVKQSRILKAISSVV